MPSFAKKSFFFLLLLSCFSCQKNTTYTINGKNYSHINFSAPLNTKPDSLVVLKSRRVLLVFDNGKPVKGYTISLGGSPHGPKQFEGDEHTPEGRYFINDKNPNSLYHKNLGISYPNAHDREFAARNGKSPGGDIKIHGYPNGKEQWALWYRQHDWTNGCIAVTNAAVDELYSYVPVGVPILIFP